MALLNRSAPRCRTKRRCVADDRVDHSGFVSDAARRVTDCLDHCYCARSSSVKTGLDPSVDSAVFLDLLAAVPSIVFGLFGNAFFCVALGMGYSLLAGGLTLACMILPTLTRLIEYSLRTVPDSYREAAGTRVIGFDDVPASVVAKCDARDHQCDRLEFGKSDRRNGSTALHIRLCHPNAQQFDEFGTGL